MAQIDLGKLKFQWKGNYADSTAYEVDDVVFDKGSTWVVTAGITTANTTDPEASSRASSLIIKRCKILEDDLRFTETAIDTWESYKCRNFVLTLVRFLNLNNHILSPARNSFSVMCPAFFKG